MEQAACIIQVPSDPPASFLKGSQGISGVIWPLFFTGVYYLVATGILTILFAKLEKKLSFFR